MERRGCFSYIFGGFIKGAIIGGVVGGVAGVLLKANPTEIMRLSVGAGTACGAFKMVIGPLFWANKYPACGGKIQSPIDLKVSGLSVHHNVKPLKWANYNNVRYKAQLVRTNISLTMNFQWPVNSVPQLRRGPLGRTYYLSNLHFHWNFNTNAGSEHAVMGKKYPMEMHVVYSTRNTPASEANLVTGHFMSVGHVDNPAFESIFRAAEMLSQQSEESIPMNPFPLSDLGINFCDDYFFYVGSLTTPPCKEGIFWLIRSKPIEISERQYFRLRNSLTGNNGEEGSWHNNRPIQAAASKRRPAIYVRTSKCVI